MNKPGSLQERRRTTWEGERGMVWIRRRRERAGERKREREGKRWLSDSAWKACLHLNTATTHNQMGGLMRRESCLNTTPRCWAAPSGSAARPNRERVCVCACGGFTVCDVCEEGLKVDAKNCVTGKHHLAAQRSVDTQSLHTHQHTREHCYHVFKSNCWDRGDFPHFRGPFLGFKLATVEAAKCSHTQLHLAPAVKLNSVHY